jgi:multiple sugar transport system substrate-binding protein
MRLLKTLIPVMLLASLVLTGCAPAEPEKIVETVEVKVIETVEVEVPAEPTDKTVVEFWTTDNEEDRVDVYEAIAERYMAEHPDVEIRIVAIEEAGITQRIATAQAANRLPDIVRMGVERVAAFAASGLLDACCRSNHSRHR